jgi:hypothetical protein
LTAMVRQYLEGKLQERAEADRLRHDTAQNREEMRQICPAPSKKTLVKLQCDFTKVSGR